MKLKIVIVGPKGAGKSSIGNYITGQSQVLCPENANYDPTAGVRILEFEARQNSIELWDASGDHK
jgi:GTPase SAR1 family protein